jgi:hypothetical protein
MLQVPQPFVVTVLNVYYYYYYLVLDIMGGGDIPEKVSKLRSRIVHKILRFTVDWQDKKKT